MATLADCEASPQNGSRHGSPTIETMAALPFSGLQEVVASVSDPKRVARVFVEIGGWSVCRLPDAPREQWQAWRVPRHYRRIEQWLLVPANDIKGWVRLVKFHGVAQRIMRSSGHT